METIYRTPPPIVQWWQAGLWGTLTISMFFVWWAFLSHRALRELTLSERILGAFILWISQILLTTIALGILHILYWWPLWLLNASITGSLGWMAFKGEGRNLLLEDFKLLYHRTFSLLSASPAFVWIAAFALFIACWMIYIGLLLPTWCWDGWWTILPWAAFAHQEGHLGPFHQPIPWINTYPMSTETVFLWFIIGCGSEHWSNIGQAPFALAGSLASYIIARNAGARRIDAALGALLIFSVPSVFQQMWVTKNDVAVMGVVLASIAFLSDKNLSFWSLILGGAAAGYSLGTKGPYYLFGILAFFIYRLLDVGLKTKNYQPRWNLKACGIFLGTIFITGTYFYFNNWIHFGNPLGLFKVQIGPWVIFPGEDPMEELFKPTAWGATLHEALKKGPVGPIIIDGFFDPASVSYSMNRIGGWGNVFTVLLLPALPVAFIWSILRRRWMIPAIVIALFIPYFMYEPIQRVMTRYHLQLAGAGIACFAFLLSKLRGTWIRTLIVGITCLSMALAIFLSGPPTYHVIIDPARIYEARQKPYSQRNRLAFFDKQWNDPPFVRALQESEKPGTTIAFTHVPPLDKTLVLWNRTFSNRVVYVEWKGDGDEWVKRLRKAKANAVYCGPNSDAAKWARNDRENFITLYYGVNGGVFQLTLP